MIRVQDNHGVRTVTLDRADKRNALTPEMLRSLAASMTVPDGTGAVLLAGEGSVFCAGFDLAMCQDTPDGSVMRSLLSELSLAIVAMRRCAAPVIIAAHGGAIAGGCALLGGADIVVADAGAKFGYPVTRLGISPAVSAPFLAELVGCGAARERLLDSDLLTGLDAHRIGLVHECLETPDLVKPAADRLARALAAKPAHAIRATRAWLDELSPTGASAGRALAVSLSLTGGDEERTMLASAWSPRSRPETPR